LLLLLQLLAVRVVSPSQFLLLLLPLLEVPLLHSQDYTPPESQPFPYPLCRPLLLLPLQPVGHGLGDYLVELLRDPLPLLPVLLLLVVPLL